MNYLGRKDRGNVRGGVGGQKERMKKRYKDDKERMEKSERNKKECMEKRTKI